MRRREGDDWDYAVIERLGTKTTLDAVGTATPASVRDLYSWHGDT